jgi:group I intron endonuclease
MEQTYCIYKITNQINGKAYIGFTKNFMKRMWGHQNTSQKGVGQAIHYAIRKYGWDNFSKEELYYSTDKQHTLDMEDVFINLHETKGAKGYNITRGGQSGPPKGNKHQGPTTEEWKRKIGASVHETLIGNKRRLGCKDSEETRNKKSEVLIGNTRTLGFKQSQETIELRRYKLIGNKSRTGQKRSEEELKNQWLPKSFIDLVVGYKAEGLSSRQIADILNNKGMQTKRKKDWSRRAVDGIFERQRLYARK